LTPFTNKVELNLTGYLIFTGEPHLVIFSDEVFPEKDLADTVFANTVDMAADNSRGHNRANFGSWLVNRIGEYINRNCLDYFPAGLNVNFARIQRDSAVVEYRCFERGIHRETLACGTGALAVAYVARSLDLIKSKRVMVLPHQCRQFQKSAQIEVQETDGGWVLHGRPSLLFQGTFMLGASKTNRNAQRLTTAASAGRDGRANYAAYSA
jgi:diaminopimelate epimerase